ncbi:hypothetical protein BH10ACT2_BH10ACT2_15400 [soil metagenome]
MLYIAVMISDRNSSAEFDRRQNRAVLRDAIPAVVALVAAEVLVAAVDLHARINRWHIAVALIPLVPAVWLGWAHWRAVRRADEFQRIALLEAMTIGFAFAMLAALTGGLLHAADVGSTAQWLQITFIGGILAWVTALAFRLRR